MPVTKLFDPSELRLGPYYPADRPDLTIQPSADQHLKIRIKKSQHKIEFKDENETHVTVEITPKGNPPDELPTI